MINPFNLLPSWAFPVALMAVAGVTGWAGYSTGSAVKQGQWNAAIIANKKGEDRALSAAAKAIAKIEVKSDQYIQPVRTEIRTNTFYRDCKHSDDSLRNINAVITGGEPTGDSSLPEAKPAE